MNESLRRIHANVLLRIWKIGEEQSQQRNRRGILTEVLVQYSNEM